MYIPQSFAGGNQSQPASDGGGNRLRQSWVQIIQRGTNDAPEKARRKLANRFVDGNDAADFERLSRFLFRSATRFGRIAQDFKLRLDDLQLAASLVALHFAVECDHLSGLELVVKIRAMKPETLQAAASLSHRQLKDRHAARGKQSRVADFADHRGHFSGTQLGDPARIQPVFVAKWQIMQKTVYGLNALAPRNF